MRNAIDAVKQIEQDFEQGNGPFADVEFPEQRLLRELDASDMMETRARIVTLFCTFDYNRNASQLVDNLLELHEKEKGAFYPEMVTGATEQGTETILSEIGFRYPSRDAHGWYKNCQILMDKYNGQVTELLLSVSSDGPTLVERLHDDGFLYLKGDKIAPMYARILNDEVAPLNNVWELDIPVDTHIRRLTKELFAGSMVASETWLNEDDDNVRSLWREVASEHDVERHVVDGGLWQIGNNWDNWGKEYWEEVTSE